MRRRRRFGQHFLEAAAWARKVVDAIAPSDADTFLEIGPGRGALTRPLASRGGRVVAVELDRDLAAELEAEHLGGLTVVQGDFLQADVDTLGLPADTPSGRQPPLQRVVAHPDSLAGAVRDASPLSRRHGDAPERGQPIACSPAPAGETTVRSALFVAVAAKPSRLLTLPPGAFRPMPEVTSAVVRLDFSAAPPVALPSTFGPLVRGIFTMRRKMLANALAPVAAGLNRQPAAVLDSAGVDGAGVRRRWRSTSWCGWRRRSTGRTEVRPAIGAGRSLPATKL